MLIVLLSILNFNIAFANVVKITDQKTEFFATGHPGLKIHGTTEQHSEEKPDDLQKDKDLLTGKIKVDLKTFSSGMSLRDKHTREKIFEVEKYPFAMIQIKDLPMKDKTFKGTLNFHGMTKEITGTQEISASSYKILFSLNLTDYGITPPGFGGMTVDNLVKIEVNGHLQ